MSQQTEHDTIIFYTFNQKIFNELQSSFSKLCSSYSYVPKPNESIDYLINGHNIGIVKIDADSNPIEGICDYYFRYNYTSSQQHTIFFVDFATCETSDHHAIRDISFARCCEEEMSKMFLPLPENKNIERMAKWEIVNFSRGAVKTRFNICNTAFAPSNSEKEEEDVLEALMKPIRIGKGGICTTHTISDLVKENSVFHSSCTNCILAELYPHDSEEICNLMLERIVFTCLQISKFEWN